MPIVIDIDLRFCGLRVDKLLFLYIVFLVISHMHGALIRFVFDELFGEQVVDGVEVGRFHYVDFSSAHVYV